MNTPKTASKHQDQKKVEQQKEVVMHYLKNWMEEFKIKLLTCL